MLTINPSSSINNNKNQLYLISILIIFVSLISYSNNQFICGPGVNCNTCLNATYCQLCNDGQFVNTSTGQCVNCADRVTCAACNPSLITQCITCMPYHSLNITTGLCAQTDVCTNTICLSCPNSPN